jgi:hypothetical protein
MEFNCLEKDCTCLVTYTPRKDPVGLGNAEAVEKELEKRVYLTCSNGHTHAYTVKSRAGTGNE